MDVKPDKTRCHISGFLGSHPLRLGIAYYYRGHYIYSQARTPIEPQVFSTKGKTIISGTTANTAPEYNKQDRNLVPERTVSALAKAQWTDKLYGLDGSRKRTPHHTVPKVVVAPTIVELPREQRISDSSHALHRAMSSPNLLELPSPADAASAITDRKVDISSITSRLESPPRNMPKDLITGSQYYTPHDRAQYLATSAPGSRNTSRATSPLSCGTRSVIRTTASSTRLDTLLAEEGIVRSASVVLGGNRMNTVFEWMDDDDISLHLYPPSQSSSRGPSRPPSQPPSRPRSSHSAHSANFPTTSTTNVDTRASTPSNPTALIPSPIHPQLQLLPNVHVPIPRSNPSFEPSTDITSSPTIQNTGRPRKASIALNEAYNAANPPSTSPKKPAPSPSEANEKSTLTKPTKCAIHGEGCDGETVLNIHVTEQARRGQGFKDLYPVIESEGHKIVDWYTLLKEERNKLTQKSEK